MIRNHSLCENHFFNLCREHTCISFSISLIPSLHLLQEYITHVDPVSQLGLSTDSVQGYNIGEIHRPSSPSTPELLPCGYLVGDNTINIQLKGPKRAALFCFK